MTKTNSAALKARPDDQCRDELQHGQLTSKGLWAFFGRLGSIALVVVVNSLASRLLSKEEMGAYFLSLSLVAIFSIISQLGFNHSMVRLLASEIALGRAAKARSYILSAVKIVLIVSILGAILINSHQGKLTLVNALDSNLLTNDFFLISLWSILYSLQSLLAEIWRGLQKINFATLFGGLTSQLVSLFMVTVLILLHQSADLHRMILISLSSVGLSLGISTILIFNHLSHFPKNSLPSSRDLLSFSWPFLLTSLTLLFLNQADIWLVGLLNPESEVAFYGAAVRISLLITVPLAIVNAVTPPFIAERHALGDKFGMEDLLRKSAMLAFLPGLIVALLFFYSGELVLELIFGAGYGAGLPILRIITGGYLIHIFFGSQDTHS